MEPSKDGSHLYQQSSEFIKYYNQWRGDDHNSTFENESV